MLDPLAVTGRNAARLAIPAPLLALAAALLTGLLLRLWGIHWGFPRVDLSPDELNVWNISARLRWSDLDTHFYNYSGLTFYLNFFAAQAARLVGVVLQPHTILLVNRLWSVFFGTLTIAVAYLAARDLFEDARAGAWAAWARRPAPHPRLALPFRHQRHRPGLLGHRLLLAGRARLPRSPAWCASSSAAWPSASPSASSSTACWPPSRCQWRLWPPGRRGAWSARRGSVWMLLAAAGAALAGFLLVSPFSLIHFKDTVEAYFFESRHVKGGHYGFDLSPAGWPYFPYVYQLFAAFPFSFGVPLWLLTAGGVVLFVMRSPRLRLMLGMAFVTLYFAVIASWKLVPTRYYLPIQPILLVLAAGMLAWALARAGKAAKFALAAAALLALAYTLAYDVSTVDRFRRDTRLQAARWADSEFPAASRIVLVEPIFDRGFIVPEGDPGPMPFGVPLGRIMEKSYLPLFDHQRYQVLTRDLARTIADVERGRLGRGDILCLSSMTFLRDDRMKEAGRERQRLWNFIRRNPRKFRRLRVFDAPFLNRGFYSALDPMYACDFVSPTIEFYTPLSRRKP